jgi:predicted RNA-binding Zn-ribbon protein involved in translation (DUF1610 family)
MVSVRIGEFISRTAASMTTCMGLTPSRYDFRGIRGGCQSDTCARNVRRVAYFGCSQERASDCSVNPGSCHSLSGHCVEVKWSSELVASMVRMHIPFACPVCGSDEFHQVTYQRSDGVRRLTGAYECASCSVMFKDAEKFSANRLCISRKAPQS